MKSYEEIVKLSAHRRRETIFLIPADCKIDARYLDGLSNEAFVAAFRELQETMIRIYEDAEKAPFDWGYPAENKSIELYAAAYNRISDLFCALAANGTLAGEELIVEMDGFKKAVRTHKKIELILSKMEQFGFSLGGYEKRADSFAVTYRANADVLKVLLQYAKAQDPQITHGMSQRYTFASFSYRWVEDRAEQRHETIFLVQMDVSPKRLQEIQYWLYDVAKGYGYTIDMEKPFEKNCPNYRKGSKDFINAYAGEFWLNQGTYGAYRVLSKVIFRSVFDSHSEKISALAEKCPGVFGESDANCTRCHGRKGADEPCSMRIRYRFDGRDYENCAYNSFYFLDPTLDSFKDIFDLFVIENKIK